MRGALALIPAVLLVLSGCGSDDDDRAPPPPPGGLTATGGIAFTATHFAAVTETATCNFGGVDFGVGAAALIASDAPDPCGALIAGTQKANARNVTIVLARAVPFQGGSLAQGEYPRASIGPSDLQVTQAAFVSASDAQCVSTATSAEGGAVVVTSTADGRLQGTVSLTLADGGTVTGGFDAPICELPVTGDLCAGQVELPALTCVP